MKIHRGLTMIVPAAMLLGAARPANAIDRDCPRGQVWDPSQGSCVKKKKTSHHSSPAKKYYQAIEHLEGTTRHPRPERGVRLLEEACKAKYGPACTLLGFLHLGGRNVEVNVVQALADYDKGCNYRDPNGCLGAADIHSRGLLGKVDHAAAIPFLEAACKLKSGKGCYELAGKYDDALGVPADDKRAATLYGQSFGLLSADCKKNAGPSCYLVGMSWFYGRGTTKDRGKALAGFMRGCASGSGPACYWVGYSYRYGYGTSKDVDKALDYFDKSCSQYDNADGCHDAGVVIAKTPEKKPRTGAEKKHLMDYGDRACKLEKRTCDLLGYLYATGDGGVKDQTLSTKWYLVGCEHGSSAACQSGAHRAFNGNGMAKDTDRAMTMWQRACDLNWAAACADLGEHYYTGDITKKDYKKAYDLFYVGCVRGDGDGCHWLGWVLHKGKTADGKADGKRAVYYYAKGCDMGQASSCIDLGHLYEQGAPGVDKDPKKAEAQYDRACTMGHRKGCISLGDMHYEGKGVPKNPLAAGQAYLRACKDGATQQCWWIDALLRQGKADEAQKKEALGALEIACKEPNEDACMVLGGLYGWGGYLAGKNGSRAFGIYDASCKRGHELACVQLGHLYSNGIGVVKDVAKAKELFTQQCNRGVSDACAWLGMRLYDEKKYEQAASLFRHACDAGAKVGCTMLGYALYTARGVPWDVAGSVAAYQKGCDAGEPTSCNNLGEAYEHGLGVDKDAKKALELYRKGCTPTDNSGCSNLARFYAQGIESEVDTDRAESNYLRGCDDAEWGPACLELADLYEKTGKAKAPRIAALRQRGLQLVQNNSADNPYSAYFLGTMYRDGRVVLKNPAKASELFGAACDDYEPLGCQAAGEMLMGGHGVDADRPHAAVRFDRACAAGLDDTCKQAQVARSPGSGTQPAGPTPAVPLKPAPKRGCACDGNGEGSGGALALIALAALAALRRRHICA